MSLFSSILSSRRFYRHFTNSPTSKPGFMLLENVQKLAAKPSIDTPAVPSTLPESLAALFDKYDKNRPVPSLKGPLHPLDIDRVVSAYPNQSKPNILKLLNISRTTQLFAPISADPISLQSLADSLQEQFNAEAVECANVLKKRRRRMRGHKHKKRLKERRHKADK